MEPSITNIFKCAFLQFFRKNSKQGILGGYSNVSPLNHQLTLNPNGHFGHQPNVENDLIIQTAFKIF